MRKWLKRKKYVVLVTYPKNGDYGKDPVGCYANSPEDAIKFSRSEATDLSRDLLYRYISSIVVKYKEK